MSAVTLWVRKGDAASEDARRFLAQHRYKADEVLDLAAITQPALQRIAKALGEAWAAVDLKHPRCGELLPAGAGGMDPDALLDLLLANPFLLKAPILVTPKGGVAGFRERKWLEFLDIGKGRS